jgi:3-phosphoshikimate 1-carboxyvinyltransferase
MGADITQQNSHEIAGEPVADLRVRYSPTLQACRIAGDVIPRLIDEIPILAVAATFAEGTTVICDAAELRVKESDRIAVMAHQLNAMGARITELPDGMEIIGKTSLTGTEVDSCTDHRVAMSLAIAALAANGSTTIHRADAAAVSYPDFVNTLEAAIA